MYRASQWLVGLGFALLAPFALLQQRQFSVLLSKAYRLWRKAGVTRVMRSLWLTGQIYFSYRRWVKRFDMLNDDDRKAISKHIETFKLHPVFSILMPAYNSPERWLQRSIETVRAQLYPYWELCIADDASTLAGVRQLLEHYARLDPRIKIMFREQNGHISAASNSALTMATGEFVALLDHDDELPEHALYMAALVINASPTLNLIYSDEDKIDERGNRFGPYFKPDWNPELLTGQNIVSHLGIYRTDLLRSIGGFREGVEGSQDWDLALRVTEIIPATTIHHIPHVLYHWRTVAGSTAAGPGEKSYVASSALRVVNDHLQRTISRGTAEPAFGSFVTVRHPVPEPAPRVSILVPEMHHQLRSALTQTEYPSLEVISPEHTSTKEVVPFICVEKSGTTAEFFNSAARHASGEVLIFLYADCLPLGRNWLAELVGQAMREGIGTVGPMIVGEDGCIVGATTVLWDRLDDSGMAWSYYTHFPADETGHGGRVGLSQNLSVLPTGCLAVRTATFRTIGGIDATTFPEILFGFDLCLRSLESGFHNVWTPHAHCMRKASGPTSKSPVIAAEHASFRARWNAYLKHDPAHNPNLAYGVDWPLPAFPPRTNKPWRTMQKCPRYSK